MTDFSNAEMKATRDHARKLKFSSYVHLRSVNKMFQ